MKKKPDLTTKVGKYYVARTKKGLNKTQSQQVAGFADTMHASRIEKTNEFQEIERYYKNELQNHITVSEIAEAHADNIRQDKDRGARNKAIEMAMAKIEPDKIVDDADEKIMIVLKG